MVPQQMEPDVKLVLRGEEGEQREISAWSQVMINASPFFGTWLRPLGVEASHEPRNIRKVRLELPDFYAEAMMILCAIWHLKFDETLVKGVPSDTLYAIAVLIDRLDCAKSIQPWAKIWLAQDHVQAEIPDIISMDVNDLAKWIFVCGQLGYGRGFQSLTSELLQRATHEDILMQESKDFVRLPLSLQETIKQRRQTCVREFRGLCRELLDDLEKGQSCHLKECDTENENFNCSSIQLGNAVLALRADLGANWQDEENWSRSINDLHDALKCVGEKLQGPCRLKDNRDTYGSFGSRWDHTSCAPLNQFLEQLEPIYEAAVADIPIREFGSRGDQTLRANKIATQGGRHRIPRLLTFLSADEGFRDIMVILIQ